MSKLLRAILVSAYCAVFIQLIKTFLVGVHEEIIETNYVIKTPRLVRRLQQEISKKDSNSTTIDINFKPLARFPLDLKYILKYPKATSHFSSSDQNGQQAFVEANCTYKNCYLTYDKSLLIDIRNFDAILFDVQHIWDLHPSVRSRHQKYIFTASDSSVNNPVCQPYFDNYFNWTWSYRLDSEIKLTFFSIIDKNGSIVGPKMNMSWISNMNPISKEIKKKLETKTKAAAWFVSNCFAKNRRDKIASDLQRALSKYGLYIDIYGWCGNLTCPRDRREDCLELLEKDYFFYLAFENSMCEDYVTEKILYPLRHFTVPIVYGGADYSRFLPPDSYIDAVKLDTNAVASLMMDAIYNKEMYARYFRWHNYYEYKKLPDVADICKLCRLLHENQTESVVHNFRTWWNSNYKELCKEEETGKIVSVET